ncbi:MAG: FliA/WhiG family RNA polymerase sigma factor [Candidatus Synoicihabitans palmerolidicus]|nr:FliA/WhiG family RNA polymerase sigma factor [Candidatus Synoicihabitans palmerolidicus]
MNNAALKSPPEARPASSVWKAYAGVTGPVDESELIERHLPLVRNVVDRIKIHLPSHVEVEDLYSVRVTGLIAAVNRFDPEQGHTFGAYATTRIRGAVPDELWRLDWCPRRARATARKIRNAITEVEQKVGRAATDEEVRLELEPKEFARWQEEVRPISFVPSDQPLDDADNSGGTLHDWIADDQAEDVCANMEKDELMKMVAERIAQLPEVQKKVLAMYYFENMRLTEIAEVFGLTESRICQIHGQAILGLRSWVQRARNR